jgi:hypothetical protein
MSSPIARIADASLVAVCKTATPAQLSAKLLSAEAVGKVTGDKSTKNEGKLRPGEVKPERRWREGQGRLQRRLNNHASSRPVILPGGGR